MQLSIRSVLAVTAGLLIVGDATFGALDANALGDTAYVTLDDATFGVLDDVNVVAPGDPPSTNVDATIAGVDDNPNVMNNTSTVQLHYHVSGTGDSILHLVRAAGLLNRSDRWFDTEQGRQAYIAGNQGRASTLTIWPTVLRNSEPGGWIIIQDNGAQVTDDRWRDLMRVIVTQTPANRCLLGILPVFHPNWSAAAAVDAAHKATIMATEFKLHPCHQFITWNSAVMANPSLVYDGQHPSPAGVQWLANAINAVVH